MVDCYAGWDCMTGIQTGISESANETDVHALNILTTSRGYGKMPNYYYDAPDRSTPDETVTFEVEMEQPEDILEVDYVTFTGSHSGDGEDYAVFRYHGDISVTVKLPYPLGARVGVREAWFNYFTDNSGKTYFRDTAPHIPYSSFNEPETMPDEAIRHWYTVTAVDVVKRDGKWFERVTMRRVR